MTVKHSPIFTIGYGGRSLDDFLSLLEQFQVEYLVDVRSKPYSKFQPEFSAEALKRRLREAGIRYVFMGDRLGGRPDIPSCYTPDGRIDYTKLAGKEFYLNGINRLHKAWKGGHRIVLMCSEKKPEDCHRSKLIGRTLTEANIEVLHIDEEGKLLTQQAVMLRLTNGQLPLFGNDDIGQTSRKSYLDKNNDEF